MAKKIDYSKIKALSQQILECIGEDSEGEHPSLPKQDEQIDDGGQASLEELMADDGKTTDQSQMPESENDDMAGEEDKKKKKEASLAMYGSVLASKFK